MFNVDDRVKCIYPIYPTLNAAYDRSKFVGVEATLIATKTIYLYVVFDTIAESILERRGIFLSK